MAETPSVTADEIDLATDEAPAFDESTAEHISLGDEYAERRSQPRTISRQIHLNDPLRGRQTTLTLYEQGFLKLVEKRRGKQHRCHRLDLRYLDPVPTMERVYPRHLPKIVGGFAGFSALAAILAYFDILTPYAAAAAAAGLAATLVSGIWFVYLSHEKICFYTLHGRARAIQLGAGLGLIGRHRKAVPELVNAIEEACEGIGEDTMIYLRSEMREHYRLRGDGVLSDAECSSSTSRILTHFDEPA